MVFLNIRKTFDAADRLSPLDFGRCPAHNHRMCFMPEGYAHGFCVRSEYAEVEYKSSEFYYTSDEVKIASDDPTINVSWSTNQVEEDTNARPLDELMDQLPSYPGSRR